MFLFKVVCSLLQLPYVLHILKSTTDLPNLARLKQNKKNKTPIKILQNLERLETSQYVLCICHILLTSLHSYAIEAISEYETSFSVVCGREVTN